MKIFLVGYMACGKSTIGRKLAHRLGWELYDTDHAIVESRGMSVTELFDRHGEEHFRACELEVINNLITHPEDCVISTGGGAPIWRNNMEVMNMSGVTIYLNRSAEGIAGRLSPRGVDKRPKLRGLSGEALVDCIREGIESRAKYYEKSTLIIDANHYSDEQVIEIIINYVEQHG